MKNIQWQDDRDIYGRMILLTNSYLFTGLRNAVDNYDADFTDALTWGQLKSKRWLITKLEELDKELGTVFLCAGWYAILSAMMFESNLKFDKIRSFDIDDNCHKIADTINRKYVLDNWQFKASTLDIHDIEYPLDYNTFKFNGDVEKLNDCPNTIINTSCEHIKNFTAWYEKIPEKILCVLQTNNYYDVEDHVNCSKNLNDFAEQTPMDFILFEGTLELQKYNRFMRIGIK